MHREGEMMEEFAPINIEALDIGQLANELKPLNLPDYKGVARLARRRDADGLLYNVPPYLEVRCNTLTQAERDSVEIIVAAHVPPLKPEYLKTAYASATTDAERQAIIAKQLNLI